MVLFFGLEVGNTNHKWHSGVNMPAQNKIWNWLFERSFYAAVNEISHWRTSEPEFLSCGEATNQSLLVQDSTRRKHSVGELCSVTERKKTHFGTIKLLPYWESPLDISDRERQIDSRERVSTATAAVIRVFARWEQISYCLPGLGADGHSIAALQIRGGGGGWRMGSGGAGSLPSIFQRRLQVGTQRLQFHVTDDSRSGSSLISAISAALPRRPPGCAAHSGRATRSQRLLHWRTDSGCSASAHAHEDQGKSARTDLNLHSTLINSNPKLLQCKLTREPWCGARCWAGIGASGGAEKQPPKLPEVAI